MVQCSYCSDQYEELKNGFTYVLTDGTVLHFCSSKCFRYNKLKRKPHKVTWIRKKKKTKSEKTEKKSEQKEKKSVKKQAKK